MDRRAYSDDELLRLRQRYASVPRPPDAVAGERMWTDRVQSFEDFLENGPLVAASLRYAAETFDAKTASVFRNLAPGLHDLLLDVFADSGPWPPTSSP